MAKVTFELTSDFSHELKDGVLDGLNVKVNVEFNNDKNTPCGAVITMMANHRQEICAFAMEKVVEYLRANGKVASCGVYSPESKKGLH
ncbi:hypothetical protein [Erwinia sp. HR93]|uniref:hypothetical protein n=1 Tax=Erwinia sp. HR93 TaxID=3094840 RepID=UPI002ADEB566|nr:hypothetical protein [Erwinia sp. HR93]MEA1062280.1 hypothetical protein [Erwinia sp. HR93]MEA1063913.1 hypothetical protein [Erwinia sp. HR93]